MKLRRLPCHITTPKFLHTLWPSGGHHEHTTKQLTPEKEQSLKWRSAFQHWDRPEKADLLYPQNIRNQKRRNRRSHRLGRLRIRGRKYTLYDALSKLNIHDVPDATPARRWHRFGNHEETHKSLCAIKFPFQCTDDHEGKTSYFDIVFDLIVVYLPLRIGIPSLLSVRTTLSYRFKNLGLSIGPKFLWLPLTQEYSHLILPFSSTILKNERYNQRNHQNIQCTHPLKNKSPETHYQPYKIQYKPGTTYLECNQEKDIPRRTLAVGDITKFHVQLNHNTATQLQGYHKTAELWSPESATKISKVISHCKCQSAFPSNRHAVEGSTPPVDAAQTYN